MLCLSSWLNVKIYANFLTECTVLTGGQVEEISENGVAEKLDPSVQDTSEQDDGTQSLADEV